MRFPVPYSFAAAWCADLWCRTSRISKKAPSQYLTGEREKKIALLILYVISKISESFHLIHLSGLVIKDKCTFFCSSISVSVPWPRGDGSGESITQRDSQHSTKIGVQPSQAKLDGRWRLNQDSAELHWCWKWPWNISLGISPEERQCGSLSLRRVNLHTVWGLHWLGFHWRTIWGEPGRFKHKAVGYWSTWAWHRQRQRSTRHVLLQWIHHVCRWIVAYNVCWKQQYIATADWTSRPVRLWWLQWPYQHYCNKTAPWHCQSDTGHASCWLLAVNACVLASKSFGSTIQRRHHLHNGEHFLSA